MHLLFIQSISLKWLSLSLEHIKIKPAFVWWGLLLVTPKQVLRCKVVIGRTGWVGKYTSFCVWVLKRTKICHCCCNAGWFRHNWTPFSFRPFYYCASPVVYLNEKPAVQNKFTGLIWNLYLGLRSLLLEIFGYETPLVLRVAPMNRTVYNQPVASLHLFCLHAVCFCPAPTWDGLAETYSLDFCNQLDQLLWFSQTKLKQCCGEYRGPLLDSNQSRTQCSSLTLLYFLIESLPAKSKPV